MKAIILILLQTISFSLFADPVLICQSQSEVEGWDGSKTHEKVRFTAYVKNSNLIEKAIINGAFKSDERDLQSEEQDTKYKRVRFGVLEDAWCWFNILLPRNFATRTRNFAGTIQYTCEGWQYTYEYIDLNCFIKE